MYIYMYIYIIYKLHVNIIPYALTSSKQFPQCSNIHILYQSILSPMPAPYADHLNLLQYSPRDWRNASRKYNLCSSPLRKRELFILLLRPY